MRVMPLRGIHEILTGPPTDQNCIDLLLRYFGADPVLDPGAGTPLALRLASIGPSVVDEGRAGFAEPLAFGFGTEHEVRGELVRFYIGRPGDPHRYAYLIGNPDRHVRYTRASGGWQTGEQPSTVLEVAAHELIGRLQSLAVAQLSIREVEVAGQDHALAHIASILRQQLGDDVLAALREAPDDQLPEEFAGMVEPLRAVLAAEAPPQRGSLLDAVRTPLIPLSSNLYVGEDVLVVSGPNFLAVTGADVEAIRRTGLYDFVGNDAYQVTLPATPVPAEDQKRRVLALAERLAGLPAALPLSALDQIEWEAVGHAYGPATDVPDMLRELASTTDLEDPDGLVGLYFAVSHQGSRFSSTPFVVPFLSTLLDERADLRRPILRYLAFVLSPYDCFFPGMPRADELARGLDATPWFDADAASVLAVQRLWPQIARLAGDEDDAVAGAALMVLAAMGDEAGRTMALLDEMTPSPGVLPVALVTRGVVGRFLGSPVDIVAWPRRGDGDDVVQAAAVARCLLGDGAPVVDGGEAAPREVVMANLRTVSPALEPWLSEEPAALLLRTVRDLPGFPTRPELDAAIAAARASSMFEQSAVLRAISRQVLPDGPPQRPDQLTAAQRFFLEEGLKLANVNGPHSTTGDFQSALGMTHAALIEYFAGRFDPTL